MFLMVGKALCVFFSATSLFSGTATGQQRADITLGQVVSHSIGYIPEIGPWAPDGKGYLETKTTDVESRAEDIVEVDAKTGDRRVLVQSRLLRKPGSKAYVPIEKFNFSNDGSSLLVFTNSSRVWRANTRGDYWVVNLISGHLRKVGGAARASSLMFAKLSPDGSRVGYVLRQQPVRSGCGKWRDQEALTHDGSPTLINGTLGLGV